VNGVATFNHFPALHLAGTYTYTFSMVGAIDLTATERSRPHRRIQLPWPRLGAKCGNRRGVCNRADSDGADTYTNRFREPRTSLRQPAGAARRSQRRQRRTHRADKRDSHGEWNRRGVHRHGGVGAASASFSLTNTAISPTLSISCTAAPMTATRTPAPARRPASAALR